MDNRKPTLSIGLLLTGGYNWVGGLYYVINIIKVLRAINQSKGVKIVVFYSNNTPKDIIDEVRSFGIELENIDKFSLIKKIFYKTFRLLFKRNLQLEHIINPHQLDVLYPLSQYFSDLNGLNCKIVYWMYDFQHKFLPHLFEKNEITQRDRNFYEMAENAKYLVVSSENAADHFRQFYPNSKSKLFVLRFVSVIDKTKLTSFEILKKNYLISEPYFVVANQFWSHKNHIVVLKAINELKDKQLKFKVIFTGKQYDHRNPDYFKDLCDYIEKNNIREYVSFTGFISREDQLGLIQNSLAVIQPSKFEGWSTVVEDAKALNKYLLLSSIPVHREQLKNNGSFFDSDDFVKLVFFIDKSLKHQFEYSQENYNNNVVQFAELLVDTFSSLKV